MPEWYGRLEFAVAKALLIGITLLVFVAAVSRSIGSPVEWSDDMAQLLFVWLCMLGANRAMRLKAHMSVDYLIKLLPRTPRWLVELLNGVLVLSFLLTAGDRRIPADPAQLGARLWRQWPVLCLGDHRHPGRLRADEHRDHPAHDPLVSAPHRGLLPGKIERA